MQRTPATTRESAILIGVVTPETSRWEVEDALNELELLADTAGAVATDRVTQVVGHTSPATLIGKGKVAEIKALVGQRKTDLVIFDYDLTPVQLRNLERELDCKLLDRTGLILDIFAGRAKTATAKTQVELAQLDYLRTRLTRHWTHLSRQKGGIGTKGPGETQIETDRQLIGARIAALKDKLERIDRQRMTQRKGRSEHTRVSLVGYTNAGKSTLMNALANTNVLAENRLFATLDATTRLVSLEQNKQILLSDTVGFIRKLPHRLIESFKSTLDEVRESDALLHLVDVTHPCFEQHMQVVRTTLEELGVQDRPVLYVFNKIDALEDHAALGALADEYPEAAFISAQRGIGLEDLKRRLLALIEQDFVERVAYVPVSEPQAIAHIHRIADVLSEEYVAAAEEAPPLARLHFRTARKNDADLARMLRRFADCKPAA